MTPTTRHCEKFQQLLRDMFQFDCADLDFGIYRIMNKKRAVIERFITDRLPAAVTEELHRDALADEARATKELEELAQQVADAFGTDAIDPDGNLAESWHDTPLGSRYRNLKEHRVGRDHGALAATTFNHLYTFFSRYYHAGDFISKRRYSKRQRYAIPYNGEEVYLYWANHDQYYVKSAEYFRDYAFAAPGRTIQFKVQAVNVEQNNVKGDKRFFIPCPADITSDESAGRVVIPFEYRPLTQSETILYGKKNQQQRIITKAIDDILEHLIETHADETMDALLTERRTNEGKDSETLIEHHLRQYTRRQFFRFFCP